LSKHILIVEDDQRLADLTCQFLENNGYRVSLLSTGTEAVSFIRHHNPDLVILDVMLPEQDGFIICQQARAFYQRPIMFLTAKDSDFDHVHGLKIGADDYLIKPIDPHVLVARLNTLFRRQEITNKPERSLSFGSLTINSEAREVSLHGENIEMTSHEFELLWYLAINAGEPQNRNIIYRELLGRDYDGIDRSVDVRVSKLRKKLGDNLSNPYRILTVWGKGYMLNSAAWE